MDKSKQKRLGVLVAVFGVVMFSAKAIMVKLAYMYAIDSVSLLLLRMLFSLPVYLVIVFLIKSSKEAAVKKTDYLWLLFFGFVGYYLASYFDFLGLQYIKAGLERIILFIYPTLVVLISRVFLKTKITRTQVAAILITYLGVVIAFSDEINISSEQTLLGAVLIFFSALTYAMYLVGSGWLIPKFGVVKFTSYAMIVSTICVVIHYGIISDFNLLEYPKEVYYLSFAMAILSTVIPSFLVSTSIKIIGSSNFSIIGSIGPISTIILANIFLDEGLTGYQVIGTLIVIAGVFLISRAKN